MTGEYSLTGTHAYLDLNVDEGLVQWAGALAHSKNDLMPLLYMYTCRGLYLMEWAVDCICIAGCSNGILAVVWL